MTIRAASPITTGNAISRHGELGVLLSLRGANAEEAGLLLRAGQFSDNQSLIAHAYDRRYLLQPIALVEQGEEFDLGRFQISVLAPDALSSDDDEAELVGK